MDAGKGIVLKLIFPDREYVKWLGEVTSPGTVDKNSIDEQGLYSNEIFGSIGSDQRMIRFGYINLNVNIIHPRIFYYLKTVSSLYKGIMYGSRYAKYDIKTNNFIEDEDGDTGIAFFMKHIYTLNIPVSKSANRQNMIDVFNTYRKEGLLTNNKLLVMPAGLREVKLEDDRVVEMDINNHYKVVLNSAKMLEGVTGDLSIVDYMVLNLQQKVEVLMDAIWDLLKGKKKHIGGHWASRAVDFSTRNIATGKPYIIEDLRTSNDVLNQAMMGLFQVMKGAEPLVKHHLTKMFINPIFEPESIVANLYNKKTKQIERTNITNKELDRWVSSKGLSVLFDRLQDNDVRNSDVEIAGKWLLPVYDDGKNIELYFNLDTIEKEKIPKLRCITYGELLYISIYEKSKEMVTTITRYPLAEQGGTFPANIVVTATTVHRKVDLKSVYLGDDLTSVKSIHFDIYPELNGDWDDSLTVSHGRIEALGLDFDGDKMIANILLSKEAILEAKEFMNSVANYVRPDGKPTMAIFDYISGITMKTLTRNAL